MAYLNSLKRSLAIGIIAMLSASFFAFLPGALANTNLVFGVTPNDEFKLYQETEYDLSVKADSLAFATEVKFYIENLGNKVLLETYVYQASNNPFTHHFKWDGKTNGQYAPPGSYKAVFEGKDVNQNSTNILEKPFTVTDLAKITPTADTSWNKDSGADFKVGFDLATILPACVFLSVDGVIVDHTPASIKTSTKNELTWDGKINGTMVNTGSHSWKMDIDTAMGCVSQVKVLNAASGNVTVTQNAVVDVVTAPQISNLGMTINPFSPNNDGKQDTTTASFTLNTTANVTIEVKKGNTVVKNLMNNQSHPAGNVSVVWNGKDAGNSVVADGNYTISVTAQNIIASDSDSVNVEVNTYVPPVVTDNNCAGFTDLPKNYSHCDEVTFVKNAGIMTGNDNGTFAPGDILQRDQVAKISLEAFGLFNKNSDYCGGSAAFPDVSKSQWSYQYVCRGLNLGMITGYKSGTDAGKYVPARGVNRVEALALILRNLDDSMPANNKASYNDVELNQWFTGFAKYAMDHSLFAGSYLYPTEQVTRLEMAQMLYKLNQQGKL